LAEHIVRGGMVLLANIGKVLMVAGALSSLLVGVKILKEEFLFYGIAIFFFGFLLWEFGQPPNPSVESMKEEKKAYRKGMAGFEKEGD